MKNFLIILFVIVSFCLVFNYGLNEDKYKVLGVVGNDSLYIDLNRNLKIEPNEFIKIKGIKPFPVKYSDEINDLSSKLNLTKEEIRTLAYISNKYLEENVKGRYVELKNFKNGEADIFLYNTNLSSLLIKNGLYYDNNLDLIKLRLKNIKPVKYYIYDAKNEILHDDSCPETKNLSDFLLVKHSDLEEKVNLCKCIKDRNNKQNKQDVYYPPFLNKGNFSLYLINPYLYKNPSNSSRTPVCKFLIKEVNSSKQSVYFAIYGVDNQDEVINSLLSAKNRGVDVSGVSDSDEKGVPAYSDMFKFKNINIIYDNKKSLMHNKFFVIDNNLVISGSMNISKTGCGGYNSNSVAVIKNKQIAKAYENEFMQMKNGIFKNKKDFSISDVKINPETNVSVYFSPANNLYESVFGKEIKNAKENIRVSIFVLTYDKIAQDLILASKRGVKVKVIADATGALSHRRLINKLREARIDVKIENWGGKNHEKTISIDENVLIMGSANFSYAAINKNDENLLVIKDKDITKFYNGFFDKLYNAIPDIYLKKFPRAEAKESVNSCSDGIDNDFDGKIDSEDEGCKK